VSRILLDLLAPPLKDSGIKKIGENTRAWPGLGDKRNFVAIDDRELFLAQFFRLFMLFDLMG
jgi:hypothetical protein